MLRPTVRSASRRRTMLLAGSVALTLALVASACGSAELGDDGGVNAVAGAVDQVATGDETAPSGEAPATDDPTTEAASSSDGSTASAGSDAESIAADAGAPAESDFTPVSFNNDFSESVAPIISENCASCHSPGGPGAAHLALATAQDLVDTHFLVAGAVTSTYMPPWPASDESVAFHETRNLRPDQIQAIADWSAAGAPLDIDGGTELPAPNGINRLADPDMVITPADSYAGEPTQVDDYRCLIYDPQLEEDGWVTGYEFLPDQLDVVHHAIGYLANGNARERARELDGADGKPGWTCFGGSRLANDDIFIGWAPGQDATTYPEGAGLRLEAGDFFVIQIHYHYEGSAPQDLSGLALNIATDDELRALGGPREVLVAQTVAPVEIPCATWETGPLCDRDAALADAYERFNGEGVRDFFTNVCGYESADFAHMTDGLAQSECTVPAGAVDAVGELQAVLGHMHEIGDWFRMTLNAGTSEEVVLLDIPEWDFDWQYNYRPIEPIMIDRDDSITIECGWDRSLRAPDLEPAYILWADGTNDEMCFATLTMLQ